MGKRIMKTASTPFPRGIPPTYAELVGVLAPRAIHEEQEDYLETIVILVDEYDRTHNEQPKKSKSLEVLRPLVKEHDIGGRELGRILGQ